MSGDDSFVSRWSRRKAQVRGGEVPAEPIAPTQPTVVPPLAASEVARPPQGEQAAVLPPPLTLEDVASLTHDSDFSRFVLPGVDDTVKRAAMKKLFSDPHFNVMDGLDTYIDDYGIPDPIPEAMLRRMTQSKFLRLFDDDPAPADAAAKPAPGEASPDGVPAPALPQSGASPHAAPAHDNPPDENLALRLQPDDAARPPGVGPDRPGPRP